MIDKLTAQENAFTHQLANTEAMSLAKDTIPTGLSRIEWFSYLRGCLIAEKLAIQCVTRLRRMIEDSPSKVHHAIVNGQIEAQQERQHELKGILAELDKAPELDEKQTSKLWKTLGKLAVCEQLISNLKGVINAD